MYVFTAIDDVYSGVYDLENPMGRPHNTDYDCIAHIFGLPRFIPTEV